MEYRNINIIYTKINKNDIILNQDGTKYVFILKSP
jgi:hypothetical protein